MKACPLCGAQNDDQNSVCVRCGGSFDQMAGKPGAPGVKDEIHKLKHDARVQVALLVLLAMLVVAAIVGAALYFGILAV